jgi:hypothetical protein
VTVRRLLAALLAASVLLVVTPPAQACACGGVVDQPGQDTSVGSETAVVTWDGTTETIALRLSTRSEAVHAGLIVPTPAAATVTLGDEQMFTDLAGVIAPQRESRWRLFGPPLLFGGGDDGASAGAAGSGVEVLSTVDLGPLSATSLSSTNPAALEGWLKQRGFRTTPQFTASIAPYVTDAWNFVAIQLDATSVLDGDLPPIAMTFPSKSAVYPMRMSVAAESAQQPMVYVLAAHRMLRTDPTAEGSTRPDVRFAGRVEPGDVTSPTLRAWLASTPYLTATQQWLPDPAQIVSDFTFEQAATDEPFHEVYYADHHLLPGDVGALLVLLLLASVAWLVVRVVRRRRE